MHVCPCEHSNIHESLDRCEQWVLEMVIAHRRERYKL